MTQKSDLIFTGIKIPLDFIFLVLAGVASYYLRFWETLTQIRPVIFDLKIQEFLPFIFIVAFGWLVIFALAGLYAIRKIKITDEFSKIILACSAGVSAVIVYMFFVRELFDSRFIVLTFWLLSILFIIIERALLRKTQNFLHKKNIGCHRTIIIGQSQTSKDLIKFLKKQPQLGYKLIKTFPQIDFDTFSQIQKIHQQNFIDEIFLADTDITKSKIMELIEFTEANNISFKYLASTFEARTTNIDIHMISGLPIIELKKTKLEGWWKIIKRIIDLVFSFVLILVFSVLMILIAIAIKIESRGPVIYLNERVAKRKTFNVYKFRSMYSHYCIGEQFKNYTNQKLILDYEKKLIENQSQRKGPVYKILNDPRRTTIGKFLEKTSLDELPQLFNVFFGNMSLVGPRPHQPREVEKYKRHHKRVLDIKPGITGLAQISGRSDLNFEEEVKLDTFYIENWSLKMDFWIMLKTPLIILIRKHRG